MLDAFGPEIDPSGTWYDEMVVEANHVVVVGFSYQRGGTWRAVPRRRLGVRSLPHPSVARAHGARLSRGLAARDEPRRLPRVVRRLGSSRIPRLDERARLVFAPRGGPPAADWD